MKHSRRTPKGGNDVAYHHHSVVVLTLPWNIIIIIITTLHVSLFNNKIIICLQMICLQNAHLWAFA